MTIEKVKVIESNVNMFLKLYDNAVKSGNSERAIELCEVISHELDKLDSNEVQIDTRVLN
jgi:ribosomal protein S20